MYELKRNKLIDLSVKCGDHEFPVTIDIAKQGGDFNDRYAKLVNAEIELKRVMEKLNAGQASAEELTEAQGIYGFGVVSLMELLFGVYPAQQIISYFEGDYADLLLAIMPFIRDEVVPALRNAKNEKLKQYNAGRGGWFRHGNK